MSAVSGDFIGDGSLQVVFNGGVIPTGETFFGSTPSPFRAIRIAGDNSLTDVTSTLLPDAPTAVFSHTLTVADLNRSGRPSVFSTNFGKDGPPYPDPGAYQSLLLNDGKGHLINKSGSLPPILSAVDAGGGPFIADIRGVGYPDILIPTYGLTHNDKIISTGPNTIADFNTNNIGYQVGPYILRNDGNGNFTYDPNALNPKIAFPYDQSVNPWVPWKFPGTMDSAMFLDVTNSGLPDLILGSANQPVAGAVYPNNGKGQFLAEPILLPPGLFQPSTTTLRMVAADFRSVGRNDLVLGESTPGGQGSKVQYLRNNGDGTFTDETSSRFPAQTTGDTGYANDMSVADFRSTGFLDIMLSNGGNATDALFWLNDGTGHFRPVNKNGTLPQGTTVFNPNTAHLVPIKSDQTGQVNLLAIANDGSGAQMFINCTQGSKPQTGWWYDASDVPGRGYSLEVNNGRVFLVAYMYRDDTTPVWYIADEIYTPSGFAGTLFDVTGTQSLNSTGAGTTALGPTSIKISGTFSSSTQGQLTLTDSRFAGGSKTIQITRFPFDGVSIKPVSSTAAPQAGWWYNPSELGVGYFIEQQASSIFLGHYLYGTDQRDRWYITLNGATPVGTSGEIMTGSLLQVTGGRTLTSGPLAAFSAAVGTVTFQFASPTSGTVTLPSGRTVPIVRFTAF